MMGGHIINKTVKYSLKVIVNQVLYDIVAIEGYFKFECVLSL